MNSKKISDAIGLLDDELLESYNNMKIKKRYALYVKRIAVAACFCLAVLSALYWMQKPDREDVNLYTTDKNESTFIPKANRVPFSVHNSTASPTASPMPKETSTPMVASPLPTVTPLIETIGSPDNSIAKSSFVQENDADTSVQEEENDITSGLAMEKIEIPEDIMYDSYEKKDWENDWPFFLTLIEGKIDGGILTHPDYNDRTYEYFDGSIDTVLDFIIHSSWTFFFRYNNGMYEPIKSGITPNDIESKIGTAVVNGLEIRITDNHYTKPFDIYKIKSVSTEAAIAVQIFEDEYYIFYNKYYKPESLKDFVNDVNLANTLEMKQIAFMDITKYNTANVIYNISDDKTIWELLLKGGGECKYTDLRIPKRDEHDIIRLSSDNSFYKHYDVSYAIYNKGFICIKWLDNVYYFEFKKGIIEEIKNLYNQ